MITANNYIIIKVILLLLILPFSLNTVAKDNFSIYLVRHAEKQAEEKNPKLTQCGVFRAKQLAALLEETNIEKIYSTSYQRTMQTARPLANSKALSVKHYNPKHLPEFALRIKQQKNNSLIVGHSNTTPLLVELLTGKKVNKIVESNYQMLYQVQFIEEHVLLTIFKQPLKCK